MVLDPARVHAYLDRLGAPDVRHDVEGLAALQWAHLQAVPFHNLLLLANDARPKGLPDIEAVCDAAIAGIGGNCDRTTPPFVALLRALGFDATLAAATVGQPGDHFVAIVQLEGRRLLCDVGNGHPYRTPWDLGGGVQEQEHLGWQFRFEPRGTEGPTLWRRRTDGSWKRVYVVDPTPRVYADFAGIVRDHYTRDGFGPFLAGVRAVSLRDHAVLALRDDRYTRDTACGRGVRRVAGRAGVEALLTTRFDLPPALVRDALDVVQRRRPDLFAEPAWFPRARGRASADADLPGPRLDEVPDVLVSLATVGRDASVVRLLESLQREVRASRYPGRVGVLIVENHAGDRTTGASADVDLPVHHVAIDDLRPALARAAHIGVLPDLDGVVPVPIGAARDAQVAAIRAHLEEPLPDLPHPAQHATVVWMLDDDLAFEQQGPDGVGRHTPLLLRVARLWSELPQHAVALGSYTGDPPIPGIDTLAGQLGDLTASLRRMASLGLDAAWSPPIPPRDVFDAYYDLSESSDGCTDRVWPYRPDRAGDPVRDVLRELPQDLRRLLEGHQLTRPLVWRGEEAPPRPSLRRGGNALFLDLDALFRWPTPVLRTRDGVCTRRADTIWAALARAEDPDAVVEVTLPLLHGRQGQATHQAPPDPTRAARRRTAQLRGTVLARAVAEGRDVATELDARHRRILDHHEVLRARLAALEDALLDLRALSTLALDLPALDEALGALRATIAASLPLRGDPAELKAFLASLPEAVQAWRGVW